MNTACPDLRGKQRTKAVPPIPHGLMADLDAALEQEIFDLSQRQRVSDIQHHREADHFGRTVEIDLSPKKVAKFARRFPTKLTQGRSRYEAQAL